MTHSSSFPEEETSNKDSKPHYKRPEFILIDDRQEKPDSSHLGSQSSQDKYGFPYEKSEASLQNSFSLRFVCLLGLIFCLIFGVGIFIWSLALTCLATLALFQNHSLNHGMLSFWKLCSHTLIAGLGFGLGAINPALGLGLIALYFSLTNQLIEDSFLHKILKRSFNNL